MKLPITPPQDTAGKLFSVLQFILFLLLFVGLAIWIWRLFDSFWIRIPLLIVDYVISSLILYCIFKPAFVFLQETLARRGQKHRKNGTGRRHR